MPGFFHVRNINISPDGDRIRPQSGVFHLRARSVRLRFQNKSNRRISNMNENKVKVKLALGIRRYKEIEVDAKDAPTIQKVNRLIWRESRQRKAEQKTVTGCRDNNMLFGSGGKRRSIIEDSTQSVLESLMIEETEKEKSQLCNNAMKCLTEKQRYVVYQVFWEEKTLPANCQRSKGASFHNSGYICGGNEKIKKIFWKILKTPRHTPQKTPYISEGQKADKEAKH